MPMPETLGNTHRSFSLQRRGAFLFYGIILAIIGFSDLPAVDPGNLSLRDHLFAGNESLVPDPGSEFSVFKPHLPVGGAVSFLMDIPYFPYAPAAEQLYTAQSYLVPLVINIAPTEQKALVYCSNDPLAAGWMQKTGYRPVLKLADGKGIAEKR